ncbi:MAG: TolC family protein [Leptospirales bacterium]|nr:TolC family protein [Leptospirales bacterium]
MIPSATARRLLRLTLITTTFAIIPLFGEGQKPILIDLETAIRVGTTNHFALQAAENRQIAIRRLISERWRAYLPSAGVSYSRTSTVQIGQADSYSNEIRLNLEQIIYDGGRRSLDLDLARIQQILARDDFRITYNQIRLDIQRTYLQTLAAKGKVVLNQKSLERGRIQLHEARREESLGFTTRVQVLTVAARLREIELALSQAKSAYRQAMHDLQLALNLDFETRIEVDGDLFYDFYLKPPEADLTKLIESGRKRRPEMAKVETNLQKLKKEREIAENAWIPRFSVGGYVGRTGNDLTKPPRQPNWGMNLKLTFPLQGSTGSLQSSAGIVPDTQRSNSDTAEVKIFDDVGYDRRVLESRIALGEGIEQYRAIRTKVPVEIAKAYDKLMQGWETIRIGNGRAFFQFEGLRIVAARTGVGDLKRSDILLQETELVRAQQDLDDAIANYMISAYELEYASGLDPGTLNLFVLKRGAGNTLLPYLVRTDFKDLRQRLDQIHKTDPIWEIDKLDNERSPSEKEKKDRYLIDEPEKKK